MLITLVQIVIAIVAWLGGFMFLLVGLAGLAKAVQGKFDAIERMILFIISLSAVGMSILFGWFGVMLCK